MTGSGCGAGTRRRSAKVKICGVTRPEDAILAADLGADYLGLNFHRPSPRYVDLGQARRIAEAVRGRLSVVAVVVNLPAGRLNEILQVVGADLLQFHGDENPAAVEPWADRSIRAFRLRPDGPLPDLEPWDSVWGWLFDYHEAEGRYGGTGRSWPYDRIAGLAGRLPILVAGGIGPDNVRRALAESGAWGLDVCSGVEVEPGIKDPELLRRLFQEVRDHD